ncbi:hypothetical protein FJZ48_01665 [Candidatus Uhrbacteria bacterium]|nr:hypothetical protein [Candidatus Uhrbacteria bacterium]
MRILIVDDTNTHHLSAEQTLKGHNIVHATTHDQAILALTLNIDPQRNLELMKGAGVGQEGIDGLEPETVEFIWTEKCNTEEVRKLRDVPPFDVVLLDLLMPCGRHGRGFKEQFVGQLVPVGFSLLFVAAQTPGVKHIAVATATNHHEHPLSAAIDHLHTPFTVNQTQVTFFHAPMTLVEGTICQHCNGKETQHKCYYCEGRNLAQGKDWGKILSKILSSG